VDSRGSVRTVTPSEVQLFPLRHWTSPRTGARYPVSWKLLLSPAGETPLTVEVEAELNDQELDTRRSTRVTYWEGAVAGRVRQGEVSERVEGYLEMTGYAGGGLPGAISTSEPPGR
jgi:predicted secreted hydrolase